MPVFRIISPRVDLYPISWEKVFNLPLPIGKKRHIRFPFPMQIYKNSWKVEKSGRKRQKFVGFCSVPRGLEKRGGTELRIFRRFKTLSHPKVGKISSSGRKSLRNEFRWQSGHSTVQLGMAWAEQLTNFSFNWRFMFFSGRRRNNFFFFPFKLESCVFHRRSPESLIEIS